MAPLCGAIVCHYVQCAMCTRGRGDLWWSLYVHSLPGKTPSPCTQSQYTASNNLTFDCFDCVLLLLSFFSLQFFSICSERSSLPVHALWSWYDIHNRISWVSWYALCSGCMCAHKYFAFYMKYKKKGEQQKRSTFWHTCKKRVMLRLRLFWPKKNCGKSA